MISRGRFFYLEIKLSISKTNNTLEKIINYGQNLNFNYIDWKKYIETEEKSYLTIHEAIEIMNRDISEDKFVSVIIKNTDIDMSMSNEDPTITLWFGFTSEDLLERNYLPDNAQDVDIFTYLNLIIKWLEPFGIEQLHIEHSKP